MKKLFWVVWCFLAAGSAVMVLADPVHWNDRGSSINFDGNQANSPILLTPKVQDGRAIGVYQILSIGPTSTTNQWLAAFNLTIGNDTSPVTVGTKGQLSGYEANITTAQTFADHLPGESSHAFGATLKTKGGSAMNVLDAVVYIEGKPANVWQINTELIKNVDGGLQYGHNAQSHGKYPGFAAYHATGNWTVGMDLEGMTLYRTNQIVFANPGGKNTPWSVLADNDTLHFQANGQDVGWWDLSGNLHVKKKVIQGN